MTPPTRALSEAEKLDWLRLIRSENVGPVTFFRLIERFGSPAEALHALPELARRGGSRRPLRICPRADAEREMQANRRLGARLIAACEPDYPRPLAAVDDAPPMISVLGHPGLLRRRAVAMVGARNASLNGRRLAERIARDLADAGYMVVSGLARGIDAAAHAGALAGGTTAVLAGGVDIVYPEENRALYEAIREQGALVAEMPVGTEPQARHFPRRNRIISGLALGVLVVEAARRSGSLITARFSLDQGREVFAIPGSPLDPRAQGPNDLIRQGAILTESAEDVVRALAGAARPVEEPPALPWTAPQASVPPESELDQGRIRLLTALAPTPVLVDELIRGCQLSPPVVQVLLLELELAGRLVRLPGNQVALIERAV